jgi:hypothetical protein
MKKLAFLLGIGFLVLLFGQAKGYTQNYFSNETSSSSSFTYSIVNGISVPTNNCSTTINYLVTLSNVYGTPYTYVFRGYENGIQNVSASITSSDNLTCFLVGSITKTDYINASMSFQSYSGSGRPVTLMIETYQNCNSNDTYAVFDSGQVDSNTYTAGGYSTVHISSISNPNPFRIRNDYGTCNGGNPAYSYSNYMGCSGCYVVDYQYPFFSGNGSVTGTFTQYSCGGGSPFVTCNLWNTDTNTSTGVDICAVFPSTVTYDFYLEPLSNYLLDCYWELSNTFLNVYNFPSPRFSLNLTDVTPNYNCTLSACVNGTATRTCTDMKHIFPDTITTISCLAANQTVYLGFDLIYPDFQTLTTKECTVGADCFFHPIDTGYNNPENPHWDILPNNPQVSGDFLEAWGGGIIGQESPTLPNGSVYNIPPINQTWNRGQDYLKLWYVPPYGTHPFFNFNTSTYTCQNLSLGLDAFTRLRYINASFLASVNFTFPSSTMTLHVDVRKCPVTPVQSGVPFYCIASPLPQFCYGNCSSEPHGNFFIVLYDNNTGQVVERTDDIAQKDLWITENMDVSNIINQDHNYQLSIGLSNSGSADTNSYCAYFDNVRLVNQQFSGLDLTCLQLYGKVCSELTSDQQQNAEAHYCACPDGISTQCCIGNDFVTYNLQTVNGKPACNSIILSNQPSCVAIQKSQAVTGNQSIFLPISSVANQIVNTTTNQTLAQSLQASGFGFTLLFLTPIFWIMLFVVAIMCIAAYFTKHMEVGIGSGIIMVIVMAAVFPELIWIAIAVIVITAFIVGRTVVKAVTGG